VGGGIVATKKKRREERTRPTPFSLLPIHLRQLKLYQTRIKWNAELQKSSSILVQEVANHQDRNNPPLTVRQEDQSRREAKRTYSTDRPKTSSLIGTSLEESKQLIYSYLSLLALNLKTTMEGGVRG